MKKKQDGPREIGMLFSTMMVQAIQAGRKNNTRRLIKPQPIIDPDSGFVFDGKHRQLYKNDLQHPDWRERFIDDWCPYGEPGDLIYVRETHYRWGRWEKEGYTDKGRPRYSFIPELPPAGGEPAIRFIDQEPAVIEPSSSIRLGWHKRPSLFLPKENSRIWLGVDEIRIERLWDISEQDAIAEGILWYSSELDSGRPRYKDYMAAASGYGDPEHDYPTVGLAKTSFNTLWQAINGVPSYEANPWLYVIKFKTLSKTGRSGLFPEIRPTALPSVEQLTASMNC